MKRIIISATLLMAAATAGAQTIYDALNLSQNDYIGTARTLAIGNAVTALGGDLGSVGINPAGSAVSPYSQFEFTFGNVSASSSCAYKVNGQTTLNGTSGASASMPNIGVNLVMDTYRTSGLKSYSFGLIANTTGFFKDGQYGEGINNTSSFMGAMATGAVAYSPDQLGGNSYNNSNIPWNYITGYQSYLISDVGSKKAAPYDYVGATEAYTRKSDGSIVRYVPGELSQVSSRNTSGRKRDLLMNFGFNFDDTFYLGATLAMPIATYSYDEYMREKAVNPDDFTYNLDGDPVTFTDGSYHYSYNAEVSGVYAKIGFIWRATRHLRVGAAIQTPTALAISERWQVKGETNYTSEKYNSWANSPESEYSFGLTTPFRYNVGVAYTLGTKGFVSVDYEACDYSSMRFFSDEYSSDFTAVNKVNKLFGARQNMLRVGGEFKITPAYCVRAGYSLTTSPEAYYYDNEGYYVDASEYLRYYDDYRNGTYTLQEKHLTNGGNNAWSLGFGYSSQGSFYCDLAYRLLNRPDMNYQPYENYVQDVQSPVVDVTSRRLSTFLVTLGWRF